MFKNIDVVLLKFLFLVICILMGVFNGEVDIGGNLVFFILNGEM